MPRFRLPRLPMITACACAALLACAAGALANPSGQSYYTPPQNAPTSSDTQDQAPGRVARLAYLSGQVQFAPAGENEWGSVEINRPMVIGDRLLTGDDGLAVLELGDAAVRIDHDSAFDFLNLAGNDVQIELSQGTLNLVVRQMDNDENFEVDTPTVAFVAAMPGVYRIDDDPDGTGSMVTVFRGAGMVYGENGTSRQVDAGNSYRFNDSTLASVDVNGLPQPDGFDRFCEARDANYQRFAQQQQYVPPNMIGGDDLYQYGRWNDTPEYGYVWYPDSVPAGWAPYRYGHWAWIDPWGWTWVGDEPWGFAPFHYGRWVYVRERWGWVPGPMRVRPVYAPALVAFIGGAALSVSVGSAGPVGWFPLGPRDVYVPWFHASHQYFTRVNVTNIRNTYVNRTVINNIYNDYRHDRFTNIHRYNHYAYRRMPGAVTAVPRKVFTDARPVHSERLHLNRTRLVHAQAVLRPDAIPSRVSLGLHRPTAHPAVLHGRAPFARPVIARRMPPPRPVSFSTRERVIARQHGRPLTPAQMRDLRRVHPQRNPRAAQVRLVAPARLPNRRGFHNQIHPIPARHAPVSGRLPVVEPLKPAPQRTTPRLEPRPQSRQFRQRQLREQSMQQQRRLQQRSQQLLHPQQGQRPRAMQLQHEQRTRNLQLQQQRRQQMQMRELIREQHTRQQHSMPAREPPLRIERQPIQVRPTQHPPPHAHPAAKHRPAPRKHPDSSGHFRP